MDCEQAREHLSEFAEDGLSPHLGSRVASHVASCEACARELAAVRAYLQAMRGLPRIPAPPDFVDSLNRRLDAQPTWRRWVSAAFKPLFSSVPLRTVGFAASVVLVVLITHRMALRPQPPSPPPAPFEQQVPKAGMTSAPERKPDSDTPAPSVLPTPSDAPEPGRLADDNRTPLMSEGARAPEAPLPGPGRADPEIRGEVREAPYPSTAPARKPKATTPLRPPWGSVREGAVPSNAERDRGRTGGAVETAEVVVLLPRVGSRDTQPQQAAPVASAPSPRIPAKKLQSTEQPQGSATESEESPSRRGSNRAIESEWRAKSSGLSESIETLRRFLLPLSGTIVSVEQSNDEPNRATITARLPASLYGRFLKELETLGSIRAKPFAKGPQDGADPVLVRILLVAD